MTNEAGARQPPLAESSSLKQVTVANKAGSPLPALADVSSLEQVFDAFERWAKIPEIRDRLKKCEDEMSCIHLRDVLHDARMSIAHVVQEEE